MRDLREARFIQEYLVDLNAAGAARRAGYSPKAAAEVGSELLSNSNVRLAVETALTERAERTALTADKVLVAIARAALLDPLVCFREDGSLKPLKQWPVEARRAIHSFKVRQDAEGATVTEVRFVDKAPQLKLLAQHVGLINKREDSAIDISDLLKAVLLELHERPEARNVTPEADWAPLPPVEHPANGTRHTLPPPPSPDEA